MPTSPFGTIGRLFEPLAFGEDDEPLPASSSLDDPYGSYGLGGGPQFSPNSPDTETWFEAEYRRKKAISQDPPEPLLSYPPPPLRSRRLPTDPLSQEPTAPTPPEEPAEPAKPAKPLTEKDLFGDDEETQQLLARVKAGLGRGATPAASSKAPESKKPWWKDPGKSYEDVMASQYPEASAPSDAWPPPPPTLPTQPRTPQRRVAEQLRIEPPPEALQELGITTNPTELSAAGRQTLKAREGGFVDTPYDDSGTGLAIGYGFHRFKGKPVAKGLAITEKDADAELDTQLADKAKRILGKLETPISQQQYDALLSVAWNHEATAKKIVDKLNAGKEVTPEDFTWSATVRGQPHAGLQARRSDEYKQFTGQDVPPGAAQGTGRPPGEPPPAGAVAPLPQQDDERAAWWDWSRGRPAPFTAGMGKDIALPAPEVGTRLTADEERGFRAWYAEAAARLNLNRDPDRPTYGAEPYDYRGAWKAGAPIPQKPGDKWPAKFTLEGPPKPTTDPTTWGTREDGSAKGLGYFGPLTTKDGKVMSELSIGVEIDDKEVQIPTLVPTLTADEVAQLVKHPDAKPPKAIVDKAVAHARERLNAGLSPFATDPTDTQMGRYPELPRATAKMPPPPVGSFDALTTKIRKTLEGAPVLPKPAGPPLNWQDAFTEKFSKETGLSQEGAKLIPWAGHFFTAGEAIRLARAAGRVKEGTEEPGDLKLLESYADAQEELAARGTTRAYKAINIFGQMIPFAVEMALSGPEYEAAEAATKTATAKLGAAFFKETLEEVVKRRAVRWGGEAAGIVAGSVRQMATKSMIPSYLGAVAKQYQEAIPVEARLTPAQQQEANAAKSALPALAKEYVPLRNQYDQLSAKTKPILDDLMARRAQLDEARQQVDPSDPASVAAFNKQIAEYTALVQQHTPQLAQLDALSERLKPLQAQIQTHEGVLKKAAEKTLKETLNDDWDDGFAKAAAKALGSQFVEVVTEHSGGPTQRLFSALTGKAGKKITEQFAGTAVGELMTGSGDKLRALKAAVAAQWFKLNPSKSVADFTEQFSHHAGWDGVFGEMTEEWWGDILHTVPGLGSEQDKNAPLIRMVTGAQGKGDKESQYPRVQALKDFIDDNITMALGFAIPGVLSKGLQVGVGKLQGAQDRRKQERFNMTLFGTKTEPSLPELLKLEQELQTQQRATNFTEGLGPRNLPARIDAVNGILRRRLGALSAEDADALEALAPPPDAQPAATTQATPPEAPPPDEPPPAAPAEPPPPDHLETALSKADSVRPIAGGIAAAHFTPEENQALQAAGVQVTSAVDPYENDYETYPVEALQQLRQTREAQAAQPTGPLETALARVPDLRPVAGGLYPTVHFSPEENQALQAAGVRTTDAVDPYGNDYEAYPADAIQQLQARIAEPAAAPGETPATPPVEQSGETAPPVTPPAAAGQAPVGRPTSRPPTSLQNPAAAPKGWLGQLPDDHREAVFKVMRRIDARAEAEHAEERRLTPPHGTIGVGMADKHAFQQGDTRREFLRALNRGLSPEEAGAVAKAHARLIADKANAQRPKDIHSHLSGSAVDTTIDDAVRAITRAIPATTAAETPAPTPGESQRASDLDVAKAFTALIEEGMGATGPRWKAGSTEDRPDNDAPGVVDATVDKQVELQTKIARLEQRQGTREKGTVGHATDSEKLAKLQKDSKDLWDQLNEHMEDVDTHALQAQVESQVATAVAEERVVEARAAREKEKEEREAKKKEEAKKEEKKPEPKAEPEKKDEEPARGTRRRIAAGFRQPQAREGSALEGAVSAEAQAGIEKLFKSYTSARDLNHVREGMEVYEALVKMDGDEAAAAAKGMVEATEQLFRDYNHENAVAFDEAAYAGLQVATGMEDPDWGMLLERNVSPTAREQGRLVFETLDPKTASFDIEEFNTALGEVEWHRDGTTVFPEPTGEVNLWKGRPFKRKGGEWVGLGLRSGVPVLTQEQGAAKIEEWKRAAAAANRPENAQKIILSLYDRTGIISEPWRQAGYSVRQFDIRSGEDLTNFGEWMAEIQQILDQGYQIVGVLAQPPCTSFTSSGAHAWPRHDQPGYIDKKTGLTWLERTYGKKAAEHFDTPTEYGQTLVAVVKLIVAQANPRFYMMENPVGRIDDLTALPTPTLKLHPDDYGEPHTKATQLWGEFDPNLPTARVGGLEEEGGEGSIIGQLGSDAKDERAETPVGFAYAFFMANQALAQEDWQNESREPAEGYPALGERYVPPGASHDEVYGEPEAPADEPAVSTGARTIAFRSGNQRAVNDLAGFIDAGQDVGVTALGMTGPVRAAVVKHVAGGGHAFIDSGAFGKTKVIAGLPFPDVPADARGRGESTINFEAVLSQYESLARDVAKAGGDKSGLFVVAPDVAPAFVDPEHPDRLLKRGDGGVPRSFPAETAALQNEYGDDIDQLIESGVQVIVPVQVGPEMAQRAVEVAARWPYAMIGIPGNQAAVSDEQLTGILDALQQAGGLPPPGFHFLGVGETNARFKSLVSLVRAHPLYAGLEDGEEPIITTDASRAQALFGTYESGTPRKGTAVVQDLADAAARDAIDTEPQFDTTELTGALYRGDLKAFTSAEQTKIRLASGAANYQELRQWIEEDRLDYHAGDPRIIDQVIFEIAHARAVDEMSLEDKAARRAAIARVDRAVTSERQAIIDRIMAAKPADAAVLDKTRWKRLDAELRRYLLGLTDEELAVEAQLWKVEGPDAVREQGAETGAVREGSGAGEEVRGGDAEGGEAAGTREATETGAQTPTLKEGATDESTTTPAVQTAAQSEKQGDTEPPDQQQAEKVGDYSVAALQDAFRLTQEEAAAADIVRQQLQIKPEDLRVAKDGVAGDGALRQTSPLWAWRWEQLKRRVRRALGIRRKLSPEDVVFRDRMRAEIDAADTPESLSLLFARYRKEDNDLIRGTAAKYQDEIREVANGLFRSLASTAPPAEAAKIRLLHPEAFLGRQEDEPTTLYQGEPFYSRLQRAVEQTAMQKATGYKWKGVLAKWAKGKGTPTIGSPAEGASRADYVFAHVDDLENHKEYTKQEVLDYLKANELQVQPVMLGGRAADEDQRSDDDLKDVLNQHAYQVEDPLDDNDPLELAHLVIGNRGAVVSELVDIDDLEIEIPREVVEAYNVLNRRHLEPADDAARAEQWSEQGGDPGTYREVILRIPGDRAKTAARDRAQERVQFLEERIRDLSRAEEMKSLANGAYTIPASVREKIAAARAELEAAEKELGTRSVALKGWKDGHNFYDNDSDYDNPIVRVRFDIRSQPDGQRVMFVQEVQPPKPNQPMPVLLRQHSAAIGFKWALRYAAENGLDRVAMTTGEQQAQRYSLEKVVDRLEWQSMGLTGEGVGIGGAPVKYDEKLGTLRGFKGSTLVFSEPRRSDELEEHIFDLAKPLLAQPPDARGAHVLHRDGIRLGGKGLRALYDKVYPALINDIPAVKAAGAKVTTGPVADLGSPGKIGSITVSNWLKVDSREAAVRRLAHGFAGESSLDDILDTVGLEEYAEDGVQSLAYLYGDQIRYALENDYNYREGAPHQENDHTPAALARAVLDVVDGQGVDTDAALWMQGLPAMQVPGVDITPALREAVLGGQPLFQGAQGAAEFAEDGKAIIRGFEGANVSTAVHELFHVARRQRLNRHVPVEQRGGITDKDIDAFDAWAGFDTAKTREEKEKAEEKGARGFERYLRDGGLSFKNPAVQRVFEAIKQWMLNIYVQLAGSAIDVHITPEVRAIFDKLVGAEIRAAVEEAHAPKPETRLMGIPVERVHQQEVGGTSFELYRGEGNRGVTRAMDVDSGNVLPDGLNLFPTYAAASAKHYSTISDAERMERPAAKPAGPVRTIRLTDAQSSALEVAGLELDDDLPAIKAAWDGKNTLTITDATREAVIADLNELSNREDAQAEEKEDKHARRAAKSLATLMDAVSRTREQAPKALTYTARARLRQGIVQAEGRSDNRAYVEELAALSDQALTERYFAATSGAVSQPPAPRPTPPPADDPRARILVKDLPRGQDPDWTEIGKNSIGQTLYQDRRGVRSYIENGVRQHESVQLIPTRGGMEYAVDRSGDKGKVWLEAAVHDYVAAPKVEPASDRMTDDDVAKLRARLEGIETQLASAREAMKGAVAQLRPRYADLIRRYEADQKALSALLAAHDAQVAAPTPAAAPPAAPAKWMTANERKRAAIEEQRAALRKELDGHLTEMRKQLNKLHASVGVVDTDLIKTVLKVVQTYLKIAMLEAKEGALTFQKAAVQFRNDFGQHAEGERYFSIVWHGLENNRAGTPLGQAMADAATMENRPTVEAAVQAYSEQGATDDTTAADGDVAGGPEGESGSDGRGSGPADGADVSAGTQPGAGPQTQSRPGARNRKRRALPGPGGDPGLTPGLYTITEADAIGTGSKPERVARNLAAIRIVKQLAAEQRRATPDEQRALVQYVGWGGLSRIFEPWKNDPEDPDVRSGAPRDQSRYWQGQYEALQALLTEEEFARARNSTQNAHYTSPVVIRAMWAAAERLGITHGSALEPSSGIGHFVGLMPPSLRGALTWALVEKDTMTAQIAAALYPDAYTQSTGFESAQLPDNHFAVSISNVPFGLIPITDRAFLGPSFVRRRIHNYFFGKALDKVAPGGLVAFITSHGTLDATDDTGQRVREYLAGRADLLGAIRLPFTAFKGTAGTEVVTDIIFLRKRAEGAEPAHAGAWMASVPVEGLLNKDGEAFTHPVNEYFLAHPEMVLGTNDAKGKMRAANQYNVSPTGDLATQLAEAVARLPKDAIDLAPAGKTLEAFTDTVPPLGTRPFEILLHEDRIAQVIDGKVTVIEGLAGTDAARLRGLLPIREALRAVYDTMADPEAAQPALEAAQAQLTKVYDAFVKKYGYISEEANWRPFHEDPDVPLLLSLEDYDIERGTATKTAVFTTRTLPAEQALRSADTPAAALQLVLGERGRIDLDRAGELLGVSADEAGDQMEAAGLIIDTPSGWQLPAQYLSGNVRVKLAEAEAAAKLDPGYATAVERLKAVIPPDIPAYKIGVRLGATWVPPEMVTQFVAHIVNKAPEQLDWTLSVSPFDAKWSIEGPRGAHDSQFATPDIDTKTLLLAALNDRRPVIKRSIPNPTGRGTIKVVNPEATALARQRREDLHKAFQEWLFNADPDRRDWAVRTYNDRFNALVEPHVDGTHLTFPGMAQYWREHIRDHQRDGIARALQFGNMLAAWVVGSGKSLWLAGTGMELRRLGLARKPLYVVPNHLISQAPSEFLQYYPKAKLLIATPEDLEKGNRQRFTARIASGDWDGVMMPVSTFVRLPMSTEAETAYQREMLDEVETAIIEEWRAHQEEQAGTGRRSGRGDTRTPPSIKRLENTRDKLQAKLDELAARPKDDLLSFEELGVDALLIDEAHLFKNLYFHTRQQAAGIPTADNGRQRAADLYMKARYINRQTNYRNVFFATGTPVSNSMAEIYVMQKLLQEQRLEQADIASFDAWLQQFGLITISPELDPSGTGVSNRTRLTDFRNLPDLSQMFRQVADVKMIDDLPDVKAARPPMETGDVEVVAVPATARQLAYLQELSDRADHLDPRARHLDNMAKISQDGRMSALDQRLVDRTEPDDPGSKLNQMVTDAATILKEHEAKKGTIIVFMDSGTPGSEVRPALKDVWDPNAGARVKRPLTDAEKLRGFDLYADFKRKLVATGAVTAKQVAFIHDIDKLPKKQQDAARKSMFRKMRSGEIRVLMGSSNKMATGMNVQDRLVAELNADPTYKPSETEQRYGRIMRQGNVFATRTSDLYDPSFKIRVMNYVTQGVDKTFGMDAVMWQLNEAKAKFIADFFKGRIEQRDAKLDLDNAVISAGTMKAIATGNPMIIEQAKAVAERDRLRLIREGWEDQVREARWMRDSKQQSVGMWEKDAANTKALLDATTPKGDVLTATINGQELHGPKAIGEAILDAIKPETKPNEGHPGVLNSRAMYNPTLLGTLRGLNVWVVGTKDHDPIVALRHPDDPPQSYGFDARGTHDQIHQHLFIPSTAETARGGRDWGNPQTIAQQMSASIDRLSTHLALAQDSVDRYRDQLANYERTLQGEFAQQAEYDAAVARLDDLNRQLGIGEDQEPEAIEEEEAAGGDGEASASWSGEASEEGGDGEASASGDANVTSADAGDGEASAGTPTAASQPSASSTGLHPIEFPELVWLASEMHRTPQVVRGFPRAKPGTTGMFYGDERGIAIHKDLFKPENFHELLKTLAHEIGHLVDWLPDHLLKRGNMLGHLQSLAGFIKGEYTASDGTTIKDRQVRDELLALSAKWRKWDQGADKAYDEYRRRATELYADALSVLLNDPGRLEKEAPVFFAQFAANIDKKPEVKKAFSAMWDMASATPEQRDERREQAEREMFREGNTAFIDLLKLKRAERTLDLTNIHHHMMNVAKRVWNEWNPYLRARIQNVHSPYRMRVKAAEKAGRPVPADENPYFAASAKPHRLSGRIEAWEEESVQPILDSLISHGLSWEDFGLMLMYDRVTAGDRTKIANPLGLKDEDAARRKASFLKRLTPEQRTVMETSVRAFRAAVKDVAKQAYDEGLYTKTQWEAIDANPAYSTFLTIEHLEDGINARIYQQMGTLKKIINPGDATVLKTLAVIRAIEHNRVKRLGVSFLENYFPLDIRTDVKYRPYTTDDGRRLRDVLPSGDPDWHTVKFWEGGRLVGRYVDKYIAASLENEKLMANELAIQGLAKWNSFLKAYYTTYRPGFQISNIQKDFKRYRRNMQWTTDDSRFRFKGKYRGLSRRGAIRQYWRGRHLAMIKAYGVASPESSKLRKLYRQIRGKTPEAPTDAEKQVAKDIVAAKKAGVFAPDFARHREHVLEGEMIYNTLAASGVGAWGVRKDNRARNLTLGVLERFNQFIETLPKAAGLYQYKGAGEISDIPEDQLQYIRTKLGSPDFLAGGSAKPIINNLLLFSNAQIQAMTSDWEVATHPTTRAGFWWQMFSSQVVPKLLTHAAVLAAMGAAASAGLGGGPDDDDKSLLAQARRRAARALSRVPWLPDAGRLLSKVGEYNRANYVITPLPLGLDKHGQAMVLRWPQDETGRLVGGLVHKFLNYVDGDLDFWPAFADILDYGAGQVPTLTPPLQIALDLGVMATGGIPRDSYRQQDLFTRPEQEARASDPTWHAARKFVGWEFQKLGAGIIGKLIADEPRPTEQDKQNVLQWIFSLPVAGDIKADLVGRFYTATDKGDSERAWRPVDRARSRQAYRDQREEQAVNKKLKEYWAGPASSRTLAQQDQIGRDLAREMYDSEPDAKKRKAHEERLIGRVTLSASRGAAGDPLTKVVLSAGSLDAKVAAILAAKQTFPSVSAFEQWLNDATRTKIISKDVFDAVRKRETH